ncbi:DUF2306 domain-containing protein [Kitasatospora sp. NPDC094015]|uniref:DUF2306 domain-containing protein n=1 Tax=Kitasatospora sp. NPDC094015 TaxID=3155205 RepID=UPI00332D68D6
MTDAFATHRRRNRIGLPWVVFSALAIAGLSTGPYLTATLARLAEQDTGLAAGYVHRPLPVQLAFYAHLAFATVALVTGPAQFSVRLRARAPRLHRVLGRCYLGCVAVGAAAALVLAPFNTAAVVGFFGFGALAVLWAYTGWRALAAIRGRDLPAHRAWMIRNFALTYAGVTLRLWLPVLIAGQLLLGANGDTFAAAYAAVPFLCWLPNLVVAEWLIRRRGLPGYRIGPPAGADRQPGCDCGRLS